MKPSHRNLLFFAVFYTSTVFGQTGCIQFFNWVGDESAAMDWRLGDSIAFFARQGKLPAKSDQVLQKLKQGAIPDLTDPDHKLAIKKWVDELRSQGLTQEAIWILRESGFNKEAKALQEALFESLRHVPIHSIEPMWRTVSDSGAMGSPVMETIPGLYRVILEGGTRAYFKFKHQSNAFKTNLDGGRAAFALDRALGLNIVPTQVDRGLVTPGDGVQAGVIQVHVDGQNAKFKLNPGYARTSPVNRPYRRSPRIRLLDFLIVNRDRGEFSSNYLIRPSGGQAAIDNDYSFGLGMSPSTADNYFFSRDPHLFFPGEAPHGKLMQTSEDEFEYLLRPLVGKDFLLFLERSKHYRERMDTGF